MKNTNCVSVNDQELVVREFNGERVIIFKDIVAIHQVKESTLRSNFANNKKHFIEGVDYYHLKSKDIARVNIGRAKITQLNVFTESGYLMLAKSLTDDLSWKVQRALVNNYFKVQHFDSAQCAKSIEAKRDESLDKMQILLDFYPMLQEEYKQVVFYRIEKGLTQAETAKILGISKPTLAAKEHHLKIAGIVIPKPYGNNRYELKNISSVMNLTNKLTEVGNDN